VKRLLGVWAALVLALVLGATAGSAFGKSALEIAKQTKPSITIADLSEPVTAVSTRSRSATTGT